MKASANIHNFLAHVTRTKLFIFLASPYKAKMHTFYYKIPKTRHATKRVKGY